MLNQRLFAYCCALLLSFTAFSSCDEGLKPPPPPTTISGTITYVGGRAGWTTKDSVISLRVAAFVKFPPADIILEVLSGKAFYTPQGLTIDSTLAKYVDSSSYRIVIPNPVPARVEYIAVVMLISTDPTKIALPSSWRVLGIYSMNGNNKQPAALDLKPETDHRVNLIVDFKNLPPQPF